LALLGELGSAAAGSAPTPAAGTVLGQWLPILTAADQSMQARQYADANWQYQVLADRIPDVPPDVWAELTPDQQAQGMQYLIRAYIGVADSDHALGQYDEAERAYPSAMYVMPGITQDQADYIFVQWITLYLDWGNALFRADATPDALTAYSKVVKPDGTMPAFTPDDGSLYGFAMFKSSIDQVTKIVQNRDALIGGTQTAASLGVNPVIAATVLEIWQQLVKISAGLDYWGHWANSIPIWTFEYLQNAAVNFAQFAITAERDFITFQERSDQGNMTRMQLQQLVTQAGAEVNAALAQASAVAAEAQAYQTGAVLAGQRANDAAADASEYASTSSLAIQYSAMSAQIAGGDGGSMDILNGIADTFMAGGSVTVSNDLNAGSDLFGVYSANNVSAGAQLTASRLNQQYEVDSLNRTANQMKIAALQAQQEAKAAAARTVAANAAAGVAALHAEAAQQNLAAFNAQTFTPDVWQRLANSMWRLYRRYLDMALRTALLMQKAYNFETDQALKFIKSDYSTDEVKGLLGADALMADIQSFTYDLITTTKGKPQPVRQTISLAQRYAYLFETQLRKTGVMQFETRVDDFDYVYPGTYAGRIESVSVEVVGLVPPNGVSGTLTNSGVSAYRTPAGAAQQGDSGLKFRVQPRETLVLSDYSARVDTGLIPPDPRMNGIFEGAGVVSSWRLELPRAVNDIDYGALLDVRLTFYYKARYDPDLHDAVLAELASLPGVLARQRGIQLRWLYPDAFFHFQDTGVLSFSQAVQDFPSNETKPVITSVGLVIATDGTVPPSGLVLGLSLPGTSTAKATTDASGVVDGTVAGSPLAALVGGTALGDYQVSMTAADNPALVKNGRLDLSSVGNIAIALGYTFTAKS
jgi:hypothetical protein